MFDESLRKIAKFSATDDLIFPKECQEIPDQTKTDISRARFKIDEKSKPDQYTEAGSAEGVFHPS